MLEGDRDAEHRSPGGCPRRPPRQAFLLTALFVVILALLAATAAWWAVARHRQTTPALPAALAEQIRLALEKGEVDWVLDAVSAVETHAAPDPAAAMAIYSWTCAQPDDRLAEGLRTRLYVAAILLDPSFKRSYADLLNYERMGAGRGVNQRVHRRSE